MGLAFLVTASVSKQLPYNKFGIFPLIWIGSLMIQDSFDASLTEVTVNQDVMLKVST